MKITPGLRVNIFKTSELRVYLEIFVPNQKVNAISKFINKTNLTVSPWNFPSGVRSKKPSIIELVLYNMASLLGGVAAGYDVRMSNVSPLHPRLQPYRY